MVQLSHSYTTTGNTIALTIRTFAGKVLGVSVLLFLASENLDVKNRLIGKDPDDCRQEEKVMTEDRIVRLKAGGEGDDRGWDCWMALPTRWI